MDYHNATALVIRNFVYDGTAPDAFFIIGTKDREINTAKAIPVPYPAPAKNNFPVNFANPSIPNLPRFDGSRDVVLRLPDGVYVGQVKWISVYCRKYKMDFGHVIFPENLPRN